MKFLKFFLTQPFYLLYFGIMSVVIVGIALDPPSLLDAPIIIQIGMLVTVVGGTVACAINMNQAYQVYLSQQS